MDLKPSESRHDPLNRLERRLAAVSAGKDAQNIRITTRKRHGIIVLPNVIWRKGPDGHVKASGGLLPYPVFWSKPRVQLIPANSQVAFQWFASAWGRRITGSITVKCEGVALRGHLFDSIDLNDIPKFITIPYITADNLRRSVRAIIEEGETTQWELHSHLSIWLDRAMKRAHSAVSADLKVPQVVDELAMSSIKDELELGHDGRPGVIDRVIDRLTTDRRPTGVDAIRFISATFRRDAELAIRRHINDPRWIGPIFRRFAAQHPGVSIEELIQKFNDSDCMVERIGLSRARRSLDPVVQPSSVELKEEITANSPEQETLDVEELAHALTNRYRYLGGVAAALVAIRQGDLDDQLQPLADVIDSPATPACVFDMKEGDASSMVARIVLGRLETVDR